MSEEMSKDRLIDLIRTEHRLLEAELEEVGEEHKETPGVEGEWSVKDLIAHITVWEQRMLQWMEAALRGEKVQPLPPGMSWDDLDLWNEQTRQESRSKSLEQIESEFRDSYRQVLAGVKAISESDLMEPDRFPWLEGRPWWKIVASNSYWHYRDHREAIQTWLSQAR